MLILLVVKAVLIQSLIRFCGDDIVLLLDLGLMGCLGLVCCGVFTLIQV